MGRVDIDGIVVAVNYCNKIGGKTLIKYNNYNIIGRPSRKLVKRIKRNLGNNVNIKLMKSYMIISLGVE